MKNVKNLFAIAALITVLSAGNALANDSTADVNNSNQQHSQTAESWFDSLFNYIEIYFKANNKGNGEAVHLTPGIRMNNHNETLVRDVE